MEGKRYGIVIGCGDYDQLPKLRCPVNDASAVNKVLKDKGIGGFDDTVLFTKGEASFKILPVVEEVITQKAKPDDLVLVYFSGHGKLDRLGRLYLAVKGTKEASLDSTSIAIDRIFSYMQLSRARATLLILDCCYSGAIRERIYRKGDTDGAFVAATQGRGLHIMTSSTDLQQSHEKEGDHYSIFTKFFLEGLQTGNADLNNDGYVSADEAYTYTFNSVRGTGLQDPMRFNLDVEGELVFAKNVNYRPVEHPDPKLLPAEQHEKFYAVQTMINMLGVKDPPVFFVVLFKYYIDGEPYMASGLTVSPGHTPNIRQTPSGFECDTFFEPHMLTDHAQKGKEIVNGVMKVRMKVELEDMHFIVGKLSGGKGGQINLYGVG